LQEVVGELDVGLVDLVDQQHGAHVHLEGLPQLAALDVVLDVVHALIAELAVAQARDGVVLVEALMRLGRGFDVPLDDRHADGVRDLERQRRLACAGLAFDEEGAGKRDGGVDRHLQVVGRDVAAGAIESHAGSWLLRAGRKSLARPAGSAWRPAKWGSGGHSRQAPIAPHFRQKKRAAAAAAGAKFLVMRPSLNHTAGTA